MTIQHRTSLFDAARAAARAVRIGSAALAVVGSLPVLAFGDGPYWPTSLDVQVAPPEHHGAAAVAAGPAGELYAAVCRFDSSGSAGIEVLRSLDDGLNFEPYGAFEDSDPEHNFIAPALVHRTDSLEVVLAMLEQVPEAGFALRIARTPVGPGLPDWQLTTVTWGEELTEPELIPDPWDPQRLFLIYRRLRIGQGFEIVLDFARSTDGGVSWSAPVEVGAVTVPAEITSAALAAGPQGVVHVAWVATSVSGSSIFHRRHLQAGDPAQSFEPETLILGPNSAVDTIELAAGQGPEMQALYLPGDGTLRSLWSSDAGASFMLPPRIVINVIESVDEMSVTSEGVHAHLVYRAFGRELRYRALTLADTAGVSAVSLVSDVGEPASTVKSTLRPGVGPAAVWLAGTAEVNRPFVDAFWFEASVAIGEAQAPQAARAATITASPNPFYATTGIELDIARAADHARVAVMTAGGRRVAILHEGALPAGRVRLTWDGRSSTGELLPAGVYYLEATLPGRSLRGRAVWLP